MALLGDSGETSNNASGVAYGLRYFGTVPGLVKIAQLVVGVVLLILNSGTLVLNIVAYLSFVLSAIWFWIYVFNCQSRWNLNHPWLVLEFYYTLGATLGYAVGTTLAFLLLSWITAIFGAMNTFAYFLGLIFVYQDWRESKRNQQSSTAGP